MVTRNDVAVMATLVRNNHELGGRALKLMHDGVRNPETGGRLDPVGAVVLAGKQMKEEKQRAAELATKTSPGKS